MTYFVFNEQEGKVFDVEPFDSLEAAQVECKWRNKYAEATVFAHILENPLVHRKSFVNQPIKEKTKDGT